jgi:predicted nucleic acid-binding Zn ribbon protein
VNDAHGLKDLLQRFLRSSPLAEGLERQRALEIWPEVVGELIAAHSEAISLEGGVLHVRVDSSVWAQELTMEQTRIKAGFARRLGKGAVREIRFTSAGR